MKTILAFTIFLIVFGALDNSHANLEGRLDLTCEREPLTPNHYSARITGPTRSGTYSLFLTEKYYGLEFPKTYKLKLENAETLQAGSTKIKFVEGDRTNLVLEISTDQVANLTFRCR
jgi:hypothetical protein